MFSDSGQKKGGGQIPICTAGEGWYQEDVNTMFSYSFTDENTHYMLMSPFLTISETQEFLAKCIAEYDSEHPRYLSFAVVYDVVHVGEVFASISGKETYRKRRTRRAECCY